MEGFAGLDKADKAARLDRSDKAARLGRLDKPDKAARPAVIGLISFISLVSLTTRIRTTVQHLDKKRCSLEASGLTLMTTLAQEESFFRK